MVYKVIEAIMFYRETDDDCTEEMYEKTLEQMEEYINYENEDNTTSSFIHVNLEKLFRKALNSPQYLFRIQKVIDQMSSRSDFMRLILMKKIVRLALLCFGENKPQYVSTHFCPLLLSCLDDRNEEVRTACEISLIAIIKGKLLEWKTLEEKVCPCVEKVCAESGYASTITLMKKMAPLIGKEATVKHFLKVFVDKCSSEEYYIRKTCIQSFGEFCTVLEGEMTEKYLLNSFVNLCRDENKDVRETCSQVVIPVSCVCTPAARKTVVAEAFALLLKDPDDCVRRSAYKYLGAFICTFADPSLTKMDYDENGEFVLIERNGYEFRTGTCHFDHWRKSQETEVNDVIAYSNHYAKSETLNTISKALDFLVENEKKVLNDKSESPASVEVLQDENTEKSGSGEVSDEYNSFQFWRSPLPDLDFIESEKEKDCPSSNSNILDSELDCLFNTMSYCFIGEEWKVAESIPENTNSEFTLSKDIKDVGLSGNEIVPQFLLDHFIAMASSIQAGWTNNKMAQYYADCLPAVALTLGPSSWPFIKIAYKYLSMDIQWKVRKTVVSSIHKLALIMGKDIASNDLAPIFEGFLRDLDEVKMGALEHLADFLKLVSPSARKAFLPRLTEFLATDIDHNWRYREEFGEQLKHLIDLLKPSDSFEFLAPLAFLLLSDRVAAVRQKAVFLFVELVVVFASAPRYQKKILKAFSREFAENSHWRQRQIFAQVCSVIAQEKAIGEEDFCKILLNHLLVLSEDTVPNVVLCVAKCLASDVLSTGFLNSSSPHFISILDTLESLKNDQDSDIRYFASLYKGYTETEPC